MTYQSQKYEKKRAKYSDPKDKSCQYSGPKRNFEREETSASNSATAEELTKESAFGKM